MHPKFLPNLWNVNHSADRLMIRVNEGRITEEEMKMAGLEVETLVVEKKEATLNHSKIAINETNSNNVTNSSDQSNNSLNNTNNNNTIEHENNIDDENEEDDADSSSDWESAYSYRVELNKNSTDDERYFSDAASFYTLRSFQSDDTSTIADFKSFASSDNESTLYETDDDDKSDKTFNDDGSETEIDEANTSIETIK